MARRHGHAQGKREALERDGLRRGEGRDRHARVVPGRRRVSTSSAWPSSTSSIASACTSGWRCARRADSGRLPHQLMMTRHADSAHARDELLCRSGRLGDRRAAARPDAGARPLRCRTIAATKWWCACATRAWKDRQAYWVCPLIEESDEAGRADRARDVRALPQPCRSCGSGWCTGAWPAPRRTAVMARFKDGEIDLLVATTVIEVGVDVPNAIADGDRERRAHGPRAAAPAARACRPRRGRKRRACCSTRRRSARWRASAWASCARPTTASRSPGPDLECAARARAIRTG